MRTNILILIASVLFFTNQITSAQTLTDSTQINLKEVEITGTAIPDKKLINQPVSIVKLSPVELNRGTGLYLEDAINENVPGVLMERRTVSAGQQFNIRGYGNGARGTNGVNSNFDGQGYKVYLNGIPVTDAEGITLMDDLDFGSLGNVEVIKGPSGTLYGLAIAGVVNLQTKKAEKGKISIGQDAMVGSYGLQRYTSHVEIGGERSSFLINYGRQTYSGFMNHTGSHKDFVNVMGDFQPSEKQSVTTYVGFSNSYDERNGELTIGQYDTLNYSGNPAYIKNNAHTNVMSIRTGVGHTYRFNKNISNTTSAFGTGIVSNVSSAGGWTDKDAVNYGLRSTFETKIPVNDKLGLSGITGVEMQRQDAQIIGYPMVLDSNNRTGYNLIGTVRSDQATMTRTISYFTEWTLSLQHGLSFTAGVGLSRMDIRLTDRFYDATKNRPGKNVPLRYSNIYDGMVSPHVAVNKVFNKMISVYASYSKGYKAPVSSYFFIPTTGKVNTGLKPEIGTQIEVGTKGVVLKDKLYYSIAAFNAKFDDKMTTVAVPNPANTATLYTYITNGGSLNNSGLEVLVKYGAYKSETGILRSVSPWANLTFSDFKYENYIFQSVGKTVIKPTKDSTIAVDYSNNKVAGVPPIAANIGIDIVLKYGFYVSASYVYRDGMYFTSDAKYKTDGYRILNGKIGIHHTFAKHIDVDAFFGGINLTDEQYPQMVFLNQLPDAYLPAPFKANFFEGINLKYIF